MKFLLLILICFIFSSSVVAQTTCEPASGSTCANAHGTSGCRIAVGSTCKVTAPDSAGNPVCRNVTNMNTVYAIFVSAQAADKYLDWQSWISSANTGTTTCSASCTFAGSTVAHGSTVTAYQTATVPYGSSCVSESRTCSDGTLSGSFPYASCSVDSASDCPALDGVTLSHGQSYTFYDQQNVAYGSTCSGQSRTCNDGTLSGTTSYQYASCSVDSALDCTVNGVSVAHGSGQYFYSATSVPYGSDCDSTTYRQYRSCTDGVMSGDASYQYTSCTVATGANCTQDGVTVNHGTSHTFYQASSASTCTGESRTCTDGTLSGTYAYASCTQVISCPATTKSWGTGCSGSLASTSSTSGTVSNTASGYSGSASYTCDTSSGSWSSTPTSQTCSAVVTCGSTQLSNCDETACPTGGPCSPAGWSDGIVDNCGCPGGKSTTLRCDSAGTVVKVIYSYCM